MKKVVSLFLVAAMMLSTFTACSSKEEENNGGAVDSGEKTVILGLSGPLTGDYASYGISTKQGAELAMEEINAAGGIAGFTVVVKSEDDQGDPAMAVNAYNKLMDDGMSVSLGAVLSGASVALTEEANKDGILLLTPTASQKEATQYDNCFRVCFTDPDQGVYAADAILREKLATKVAVVYDKSNDYSTGIATNFETRASEIGLEIATKQAFTKESSTDFTVQLQAVKDSGADMLFMPIYAQEAAYVLTQAADMGLTTTFMGCDGLDGIIEKIGADNLDLVQDVMLLTPFDVSSASEPVASFVADYKAKYNATPDQFAADGYDAVYAVKLAMEKAGVTELGTDDFNAALIKAMTEIELEGTTGTMTWTPEGEPVKTASVVKIQDEGYVSVG